MDRLREYEDTGLSPKNITEIQLKFIKLKQLLKNAVEGMECFADIIRDMEESDRCCGLCEFDGPAEMECPGWEESHCFRWQHKDEYDELVEAESTVNTSI